MNGKEEMQKEVADLKEKVNDLTERVQLLERIVWQMYGGNMPRPFPPHVVNLAELLLK